MESLPKVLTIAGSDSGGGAGIQADLKTIAALGCYGTSAVTAITAQNTLGVFAVEGISTGMVAHQIQLVLDDIGTDAIKTGMLFSQDTINVVVETLEKHFGPADRGGREKANLVVDPVCVSTSGHSLLPLDAVDALRKRCLPWATVVTPNIPEAEFLAGWERGSIQSVRDMERCAAELGELGVRYVYLKGGHMPFENAKGRKVVVDLLWDSETRTASQEERPFLDVKNTHGTGCTLAAAIAAELAKGRPVPQAVVTAADYVAAAIAASYPVGAGAGPVNHFHSLVQRSLPLPTPHSTTPFTDYLIGYNRAAWERYVHHPFPNGLADGTMPLDSFLHFIQQDYHFLKQYGRSNSLAAYKTDNMELMAASIEIVNDVIKETEMHVKYCEKYGISRQQLQAVPESTTNIAYTRYVLDTSMQGDLLDARVVTAPCLIGYGHVGARLLAATEGVETDETKNPYWEWIKEYGSDWYQGAVRKGIQLLEDTLVASPVSPARLLELAKIFEKATLLEIAFWDAAILAHGADQTAQRLDMPQ
ncbi:hypothetical protein B0A53_03255 [Rhodotorula sp. CCFEE 5036]|nr:hypothetical protein B0A53_03255 [Rhodotorula sp. CCFEE 5036]